MAKDYSKQFYNSKQWQQCRDAYIKSVFYLCEQCGKPGYILHHTEPLTPDNINNPYVTLNHDKLKYLCLDCHNRIDSDKYIRDDVMFDSNGQLVKR